MHFIFSIPLPIFLVDYNLFYFIFFKLYVLSVTLCSA